MSASPLGEDVPQPTFTRNPQSVRAPMFPESPRREPGASLKGEPAKWEPPLPVAELARARDGLLVLDAARENHQQYAAAVAADPLPVRIPGASIPGAWLESSPLFDVTVTEHYGTGPQPAVAPVEAPEADGTWLLDFLGPLLDDGAEGAVRRITTPCPSCAETIGFCEDCQDALARGARYSRLAELIEAAPDDRGAVLVLMAGAWRQTTPDESKSAAEVTA